MKEPRQEISRDTLSPAKRALLEQRLRGHTATAAPAATIECQAPGEPLVLASGQQRLWFLHQLDPHSPAYNLHQAVRIAGPLEASPLERSLHEVVHRHQVLRTTFEKRERGPAPVIAPEPVLNLRRIDLGSLPDHAREARARELAAEEVSRPFDLSRPPLLRTLLLRLSRTDHVLVVTMHHIVSDEWSLDLFWREVAALYRGFSVGDVAVLPALPVQYSDYASWQRRRIGSAEGRRQLDYWREKLKGELAPLEIPTDHPHPTRRTFRGALEGLTLSRASSQPLRAVTERHGLTPFVLLLTAFKILLHRYTGRTDLVVGAPVTHRSRPELEALIGFFINSLCLRTDLSGDPSVAEAMARVRATVLEAFANQEVPFEMLVDSLKPERRFNQNPLFQVMFVLQGDPSLSGFPPDLALRPFPVETGAAKFDLTLFAAETPDGLKLTFEHRTDLFTRAGIRGMLEHLRMLLEGIAENPNRPISELPLLSASERRKLLFEWNATSSAQEADLCVHQLFEMQVERAPDAIAVAFEGEELSYRSLNAVADAIGARLRGLGVKPDTCVGVCLDRSPEMLAAVLGILKAGGAYLPLDPGYPEARLEYAISDAGAPVVLTRRSIGERLLRTGARVVFLDEDPEPTIAAANQDVQATPGNLAYVIYTSGSTGRPKGVPVTHRNLLHSTRARISYYAETPERFLLLPSFAFDSSVAGIFWTLCTGGSVVLPRQRAEQDVRALADLIARRSVTHVLCLPSLYDLIREHADPSQLRSLRTVIVAGEACPPGLARRHFASAPGARLFNEYGPTEATVWSTVYEVASDFSGARVPIGRPIADTRVYVLDDRRRLLPSGLPGELYLGGAGITGGYLHRPDETTEAFVPDPFGGSGARLYRTGDLVRWRTDGNLEFLGRTDQQLKIRGYRIEPGEIETALGAHPGVRESVVTTRAEAPGAGVPGQIPEAGALLAALLRLGSEEADRLLDQVEQLAPPTRTLP